MTDFNITAAAVGQLAAFIFYAYVVMQTLTAILSSWLGPRKLMTATAGVTSLGTSIWGLAESFLAAAISLLIVGAPWAVAIVQTLELSGRSLPYWRFTFASGLSEFRLANQRVDSPMAQLRVAHGLLVEAGPAGRRMIMVVPSLGRLLTSTIP
jgi:hypothetical protein